METSKKVIFEDSYEAGFDDGYIQARLESLKDIEKSIKILREGGDVDESILHTLEALVLAAL